MTGIVLHLFVIYRKSVLNRTCLFVDHAMYNSVMYESNLFAHLCTYAPPFYRILPNGYCCRFYHEILNKAVILYSFIRFIDAL